MSKKPETIFAELIDKELKKVFGKNIWVENIQQVGKRGTPDRLICLNGHFIAFELKVEGGVVDPLQSIKLMQIRKAGGIAYIVSPQTWGAIFDFLKVEFLNEYP